MQFHVNLDPLPSLIAVQDALTVLDPSVLVDAHAPSRTLRISTLLDEEDIAHAMRTLGIALRAADVVRQPSECCGGCGG